MANQAGNMGAGMACFGEADPILRSCLFTGNVAHTGGAISVGTRCRAHLQNCRALKNTALGLGGGLQGVDGGELHLRDCLVEGNRGGDGGGLGLGGGLVEAERCTLMANVADFGGGASFLSGDVTLRSCVIRGNVAQSFGGGCNIGSSTVKATACVVDSNRTEGTGGGLYVYDSNAALVSSGILHNQAGGDSLGQGGAVFVRESMTELQQCTLSGNQAPAGAGVFVDPASIVTLENVILALGVGGEAIGGEVGFSAVLSCCDLWGNAGGDWIGPIAGQVGAGGNISLDPLFCSTAGAPLEIRDDSPCAPLHNPECGLIGAWPVSCGLPSGLAGPGAGERDHSAGRPDGLSLTCSPNPARQGVRVVYRIPRGSTMPARLDILDPSGRVVRTLLGEAAASDAGTIEWDGLDSRGAALPGGVYFCRLSSQCGDVTGKLLFLGR